MEVVGRGLRDERRRSERAGAGEEDEAMDEASRGRTAADERNGRRRESDIRKARRGWECQGEELSVSFHKADSKRAER